MNSGLVQKGEFPDGRRIVKTTLNNVEMVSDCFIRNRQCGKILGQMTDRCFIAIPSDRKFKGLMTTIKAILEKKGIDGYVAIDNINPNKDIFCTSICGAFIESAFCIVVSDAFDRQGNVNVHYEHGLITALNKKVIFLRDKKSKKMPFDVTTLWSLSYNINKPVTIKNHLSRAINKILDELEKEGKRVRTYVEEDYNILRDDEKEILDNSIALIKKESERNMKIVHFQALGAFLNRLYKPYYTYEPFVDFIQSSISEKYHDRVRRQIVSIIRKTFSRIIRREEWFKKWYKLTFPTLKDILFEHYDLNKELDGDNIILRNEIIAVMINLTNDYRKEEDKKLLDDVFQVFVDIVINHSKLVDELNITDILSHNPSNKDKIRFLTVFGEEKLLTKDKNKIERINTIIKEISSNFN